MLGRSISLLRGRPGGVPRGFPPRLVADTDPSAELAWINNNIASAWPWVERIRARGSTGSDCKIRGCRRSPPARTFRRLADCNCKKRTGLIRARTPQHLSGLADAKVEQNCHRYGHYVGSPPARCRAPIGAAPLPNAIIPVSSLPQTRSNTAAERTCLQRSGVPRGAALARTGACGAS